MRTGDRRPVPPVQVQGHPGLTPEEVAVRWPSTTWGEAEWFAALTADPWLYAAILRGIARAPVRLPISPQQLRVLEGLSHGLTNAEIGRQMYVTEDTVKMHLRRAYERLEVHTQAHAVAVCLRRGLLT